MPPVTEKKVVTLTRKIVFFLSAIIIGIKIISGGIGKNIDSMNDIKPKNFQEFFCES